MSHKHISSEKAFTLVEPIVVIAIIAVLAGVSVGAYIGISNKAKKTAFEADAKTAYDHYYANLISQSDQSDITDFKAMYTDGKNYEVYLGPNNSLDLGTWDKTTNTFSNDSTKNYLLDVNSLGYKVLLNLNNGSKTTSEYRLESKKDTIIPLDTVIYFPEITQKGTIEETKEAKWWYSPFAYLTQSYVAEDSDSYNGKAMWDIGAYPKYNPTHDIACTYGLFSWPLNNLYYGHYQEDLYYDWDHQLTSYRCFYSPSDVKLYYETPDGPVQSHSYDDSSTDGPIALSTMADWTNNPSVDLNYDTFEDIPTGDFFASQPNPYSTVNNVTISEGYTCLGSFLSSSSSLSAFCSLKTASLPSTYSEIGGSSSKTGGYSKLFSDYSSEGMNTAASSLEKLIFADGSKEKIYEDGLAGMTSLKEIDFGKDSSITIGPKAFEGDTALVTAYSSENPLAIPDNTTFTAYSGTREQQLADFPFPDGVFLSFTNETVNSSISFNTYYSAYPNYSYSAMSSGTLAELLTKSDVSAINAFSTMVTDGPKESQYTMPGISDIPAGKKILFPYNRSPSFNATCKYGDDRTKMDAVLKETDCSLTVVLDRDLALEGTLTLGAERNIPTQDQQGLITGQYVTLDLNGHTLTVNNGGVLEAAGYVKNSGAEGGIVVKSGGTVKASFAIWDFNGGSYTTLSLNSGNSPFGIYAFPYLNADTTFEYGSSLSALAVLYAISQHNEAEIPLLGNAGSVIQWGSDDMTSKITRKATGLFTDNSDLSKGFRETYLLNGSFSTNPISFKATDLSFPSVYYVDFPLSPFFTVELQTGKAILRNTLKVMPGSIFKADSGAKVEYGANTSASYAIGLWGANAYSTPLSNFASVNGTALSGQTSFLSKYTAWYGKLGTLNRAGSIELQGSIAFDSASPVNPYILAGNVTAASDALASITSSKAILKDNCSDFIGQYMANPTKSYQYVNSRNRTVTGYTESINPDVWSVSLLTLNGTLTQLSTGTSLTANGDGTYASGSQTYAYFFTSDSFLAYDMKVNITDAVKGTNQITNRKGDLQAVTAGSDHTVTCNSKTYVFFNGIMVPYDATTGKATLTRFEASYKYQGRTNETQQQFDRTSVSVSYNGTAWVLA
jgi:prepilin-type N-terminal cleavage/methylation domain-containing protein